MIVEANKKLLWTGRALSAAPALLMTFSAVMKLSGNPQVTAGLEHLQLPVDKAFALGVLELACVVVYAIPPTGYLGGAMLTHLRIGEPVFTHILLGVVFWLGLWLREPRLRTMLPLRR
jgi:hypothetical protein